MSACVCCVTIDCDTWWQEDRSEAGMLHGVRQAAVFVLFLTEGAVERYFVQREMAEAFR